MKQIFIGQNLISAYSIVVAKDAPFDVRECAWRLQQLIAQVCDLTLPLGARVACRKKAIRFSLDANLGANDYRVTADEKGNLLIAAGHYTGIVAAYRQMEAQIRASDSVTLSPFAGKTDLPLTWQADPAATGHTKDKQDNDWTLVNSEVISGFDFSSSYRLVWNDEFDGDKIDLEKWSGSSNMTMPDVRLSFDEPTVAVRDGSLVMTADWHPERTDKPYTSNYTVATHDTMNFSGGYLEMRAKVPCKGLGEWPSFWLHSFDTVLHKQVYRDAHDGKLNDGGFYVEVDIFEQFSLPVNRFIPNLHKHFGRSQYFSRTDYESLSPKDGQWYPLRDRQLSGIDRGEATSGTPAYIFPDAQTANDWHTFGFLWTADRMAFSVDGVFYYSYQFSDSPEEAFNVRVRHKDTKEETLVDMTGYRRENIALSVLLNNMMFTDGYAASPGGKWIRDLYDEKGNKTLDWRELNLEDRPILFPLVYEVDYMRLYQTEGDALYTPDVIGEGQKLYDARDPRWQYALHGRRDESCK